MTSVFIHVQVTRLPWDDDEIVAETALISEQLADINRRGVLTINSQPRINCAPSTDPSVGWGIPNGYIYQKVNRQAQRRAATETIANKLIHILLHIVDAFIVTQIYTFNRCFRFSLYRFAVKYTALLFDHTLCSLQVPSFNFIH